MRLVAHAAVTFAEALAPVASACPSRRRQPDTRSGSPVAPASGRRSPSAAAGSGHCNGFVRNNIV